MTNLAQNLTDTAGRHGDRPAVRLDDADTSYARLADQVAAVAGEPKSRGLAPGDRVAMVLPNVPAFPALFYGALSAGCVVVPMNPLLKDREVRYYLDDSGASLVLSWAGIDDEVTKGAKASGVDHVSLAQDTFEQLVCDAEPLETLAERENDDDAVILYTSGTTGKPKGAQLTRANLRTNADLTVRTLVELTPDDVVMGCLPLFHVFGLTCGMNASVQTGACLTLVPRFDPTKALQVIARDKVTVFEGVPTMYAAMLNLPGAADHDVSTLRTCISGGSAMPAEVMRGFEKAFGCIVLEGSGLSETSPVASFNQPGAERRLGTIGTPVEGMQMRCVDAAGEDVPQGEVGEIVIRGTGLMKGYWRQEDATADAIPDGWFRSGDMATVDSDGYFTIVDRKKDLIIRGGYNVDPREVEEVLYEHPAVAEAAVVGVPHPTHGEEIAAAVALKPDRRVDVDELREFAKQRLAAYKYPRQIWLVDALPKGPTGKILRREVHPPQDSSS